SRSGMIEQLCRKNAEICFPPVISAHFMSGVPPFMAASSGVLSARLTPVSYTRLAIAYILMVAATIVAYLAIRTYGETLTAPSAVAEVVAHAPPKGGGVIGAVVFALLVIMVLARLLGSPFRYFHQPPVIGEIIAGIMLGPSLLGHLAPAVSGYVF